MPSLNLVNVVIIGIIALSEKKSSFLKSTCFLKLHDSIIHGSLVKGLRRRPLTAETRVRFPYGLLTDIYLIKYSPTRKHRIYAMFLLLLTPDAMINISALK